MKAFASVVIMIFYKFIVKDFISLSAILFENFYEADVFGLLFQRTRWVQQMVSNCRDLWLQRASLASVAAFLLLSLLNLVAQTPLS